MKEHIKNFVQATQMENVAKKVVKKFSKNISDVIEVKPDRGKWIVFKPLQKIKIFIAFLNYTMAR